MRNQKLGIGIDQTVVMESPNIVDSTYSHKYEVFKQRLLQQSEVSGVCASTPKFPGPHRVRNTGMEFAD